MASGRNARLPHTPTSNIQSSSDSIDNQNHKTTSNSSIPGDELNVLGPELAVATTQVLEGLSDNERQIILDVLNRDEGVRKREATRIMLLKAELQNLRRAGAIKVGGSSGGSNSSERQQRIGSNRYCSRCSIELGRIINRGAPCRICRLRVCKTCREFATHTTDWICIVCYKKLELQATTGTWTQGYSKERPRRSSISREHISTSDILRKSMRRSWTISNPENDNQAEQNIIDYNTVKPTLSVDNTVGSYPSLICQQQQQNKFHHYQKMDDEDNTNLNSIQRRTLRQPTLPITISSHSENITYFPQQQQQQTSLPQQNSNIKSSTSPKRQLSLQYGGATQITEEIPIPDIQPYQSVQRLDVPSPSQQKFIMRRQSTLPCKTNEHGAQMYMSTSPNQSYSRSPERSDSTAGQRYSQFIRQSTFPANTNESSTTYAHHKPKILPTSPNCYTQQQFCDETGEYVNKQRIIRQTTLPNPDQHLKLLPTSPSKRQTSPQYVKRSPEFTRQITMPNPDSFNTLTVQQNSPKFLPISPRQKQNFLFPGPPQNPRQFLSQQNVPNVDDTEYYSSNTSVNIHARDQVKMIKVRSHSNEEYTSRPYPTEGRRLLPEIPLNRSPHRSYSRLVRQDNVKEDTFNKIQSDHQKISPRSVYVEQSTQQFQECDDGMQQQPQPEYSDCYQGSSFLESDETQYEIHEAAQHFNSEPKITYNNEQDSIDYATDNQPSVQNVDNFPIEISTNYSENIFRGIRQNYRPRRRKSRELPEIEFKQLSVAATSGIPISCNDQDNKRKPEAFRSISEDSGVKPPLKPVTRRSLSHPEKESQFQRKSDVSKIPSPRPLSGISERIKNLNEYSASKMRKNEEVKEHKLEENLSKDSLIDQNVEITTNTDQQQQKIDLKESNLDNIPKQESGNIIECQNNESGGNKNQEEEEEDQHEKIANQQDLEEEKSIQPQEHKSTLGEAEIQNAVEAAAVIFKKVVLQRRKEKAAEEGKISSTNLRNKRFPNNLQSYLVQDDIISDYDTASSGSKTFSSETDEYKLVFISSDSSSKEEEFEDSSSTTSSVCNKMNNMDDCDWDYFEPGAILKNSFCKNLEYLSSSQYEPPIIYNHLQQQQKGNFSSIDSSLYFYRNALSESSNSSTTTTTFHPQKLRESDIGTDEEILLRFESSSPTSSDGFSNTTTTTNSHHHHVCNLKNRRHHSNTNTMKNHLKPVMTMATEDIVTKPDNSQRQNYKSILQRQQNELKQQQEENQEKGINNCCCGGTKIVLQPQYVPIPIPIPVPMAAFNLVVTEGNDCMIKHNQAVDDIFQIWNTAVPNLFQQQKQQQQHQQQNKHEIDVSNSLKIPVSTPLPVCAEMQSETSYQAPTKFHNTNETVTQNCYSTTETKNYTNIDALQSPPTPLYTQHQMDTEFISLPFNQSTASENQSMKLTKPSETVNLTPLISNIRYRLLNASNKTDFAISSDTLNSKKINKFTLLKRSKSDQTINDKKNDINIGKFKTTTKSNNFVKKRTRSSSNFRRSLDTTTDDIVFDNRKSNIRNFHVNEENCKKTQKIASKKMTNIQTPHSTSTILNDFNLIKKQTDNNNIIVGALSEATTTQPLPSETTTTQFNKININSINSEHNNKEITTTTKTATTMENTSETLQKSKNSIDSSCYKEKFTNSDDNTTLGGYLLSENMFTSSSESSNSSTTTTASSASEDSDSSNTNHVKSTDRINKKQYKKYKKPIHRSYDILNSMQQQKCDNVVTTTATKKENVKGSNTNDCAKGLLINKSKETKTFLKTYVVNQTDSAADDDDDSSTSSSGGISSDTNSNLEEDYSTEENETDIEKTDFCDDDDDDGSSGNDSANEVVLNYIKKISDKNCNQIAINNKNENNININDDKNNKKQTNVVDNSNACASNYDISSDDDNLKSIFYHNNSNKKIQFYENKITKNIVNDIKINENSEKLCEINEMQDNSSEKDCKKVYGNQDQVSLMNETVEKLHENNKNLNSSCGAIKKLHKNVEKLHESQENSNAMVETTKELLENQENLNSRLETSKELHEIQENLNLPCKTVKMVHENLNSLCVNVEKEHEITEKLSPLGETVEEMHETIESHKKSKTSYEPVEKLQESHKKFNPSCEPIEKLQAGHKKLNLLHESAEKVHEIIEKLHELQEKPHETVEKSPQSNEIDSENSFKSTTHFSETLKNEYVESSEKEDNPQVDMIMTLNENKSNPNYVPNENNNIDEIATGKFANKPHNNSINNDLFDDDKNNAKQLDIHHSNEKISHEDRSSEEAGYKMHDGNNVAECEIINANHFVSEKLTKTNIIVSSLSSTNSHNVGQSDNILKAKENVLITNNSIKNLKSNTNNNNNLVENFAIAEPKPTDIVTTETTTALTSIHLPDSQSKIIPDNDTKTSQKNLVIDSNTSEDKQQNEETYNRNISNNDHKSQSKKMNNDDQKNCNNTETIQISSSSDSSNQDFKDTSISFMNFANFNKNSQQNESDFINLSILLDDQVDELTTISNDVDNIINIPKQETDYLVEKLVNDVKSINENYIKENLTLNSSIAEKNVKNPFKNSEDEMEMQEGNNDDGKNYINLPSNLNKNDLQQQEQPSQYLNNDDKKIATEFRIAQQHRTTMNLKTAIQPTIVTTAPLPPTAAATTATTTLSSLHNSNVTNNNKIFLETSFKLEQQHKYHESFEPLLADNSNSSNSISNAETIFFNNKNETDTDKKEEITAAVKQQQNNSDFINVDEENMSRSLLEKVEYSNTSNLSSSNNNDKEVSSNIIHGSCIHENICSENEKKQQQQQQKQFEKAYSNQTVERQCTLRSNDECYQKINSSVQNQKKNLTQTTTKIKTLQVLPDVCSNFVKVTDSADVHINYDYDDDDLNNTNTCVNLARDYHCKDNQQKFNLPVENQILYNTEAKKYDHVTTNENIQQFAKYQSSVVMITSEQDKQEQEEENNLQYNIKNHIDHYNIDSTLYQYPSSSSSASQSLFSGEVGNEIELRNDDINICNSSSNSYQHNNSNAEKLIHNNSLSRQYRESIKNLTNEKFGSKKQQFCESDSIINSNFNKMYSNDIHQNQQQKSCSKTESDESNSYEKQATSSYITENNSISDISANNYSGIGDNNEVTVITSGKTLSAVVCLEDGLADDDSWIEDISQDEDEYAGQVDGIESGVDDSSGDDTTMTTPTNLMQRMFEREDEYIRTSIDFTLHTIVEESCEESEIEQKNSSSYNKQHNVSASELEKYFFYGLGDGKPMLSSIDTKEESASEVSSICSDGLDSLSITDYEQTNESNETQTSNLASSRLEKYFLSGFMGFSQSERNESDESGSVGSDSEGRPSPSQRRKRLVRARSTPRSHNSSFDNLLASGNENDYNGDTQKEHLDSSESETFDDTVIHVEKSDNSQSDTIKRKKQTRKRHDSDEKKPQDILHESTFDDSLDRSDLVKDQQQQQNEYSYQSTSAMIANQSKMQHSRDSGFIGSNDDLNKKDETIKIPELRVELADIKEDSLEAKEIDSNQSPTTKTTIESNKDSSNLIRKDSFNNWSSDEETNLMMSKMRQFFKTLVAASANAQIANSSKSSTPLVSGSNTPKQQETPVLTRRAKSKPPQLAYFESELTRLMKTVPGINNEQVREIVEYLSSEDTWSDSYDSSDYTSSDLEGAAQYKTKTELKEQISASCQQIINKFDYTVNDEEGDRGDGGLFDENHILNPETALVYQKLVASFSQMATGNTGGNNTNVSGASSTNEKRSDTEISNKSPQLLAKVMQHIGTRLVALMHEVSSGDSHASNSPVPPKRHHKKLQDKISMTSANVTERNDTIAAAAAATDVDFKKPEDIGALPRSKSHDLLLSTTRSAHYQSTSGVSDTSACEEKEASDYERFSWRGSFESALLANGDSRTKLTHLDRDNSSSASVLAAKRRSAGDLLISQKSLSREQLDRVRSCGSIGGKDHSENDDLSSPKLCWGDTTTDHHHNNHNNHHHNTSHRRSSVPDSICESNSSSDEINTHTFPTRSTLPRSLQISTASASTNSLPRLPTTNLTTLTTTNQMQKAQSVHHFSPNSVKSARYRSPGLSSNIYSRSGSLIPKKALSSSGLQQLLYAKRNSLKRYNCSEKANLAADLGSSSLHGSSSKIASRSASPIASHSSASSDPWPSQSEEDIDRLVALHQNRSSFSSLGFRSDSMASVYSGAGEGRYGTVTVKGQVEFGIQYNYKQNALEIHIIRCKDLATIDVKKNRSDPYVKVYLLPDKSKSGKRKTKIKKHTTNPVFDEVLKFHTPLSSLESKTLWLTVWNSDILGRNDFLGEVTINLQGKVFDNPQPQWYLLQERSEPFDNTSVYRGDIIIALKFVPPENTKTHSASMRESSVTINQRKFGSIKSTTSALTSSSSSSSKHNLSLKGQLHVLVKEAKHLSPVKANGSCDAFCKSYLLPDKTRSSKQKTHVVKRSVNPMWNYTFIYEDLSLEELSERALELTVWDHDRLASNEFLGGVRFSLGTGKYCGKNVDWMDANGKELSLWQNMLNRPNFWVEGAVELRSSLDGVKTLP